MTPPLAPHIPGLFNPNTHSELKYAVAHWSDYVNLSLAQFSQCFIDRVSHCKCAGGKEHEFLRFEILSPAGNCKALVIADRRVELDRDDPSGKVVIFSTPLMNSSSVESSAHDPSPALDYVYVATMGTSREFDITDRLGAYDVLRTLTYPADRIRPSAAQLCTLLDVTNAQSRVYEIYNTQCYWYSHTVFTALSQLFPTVDRTSGEKEGRKGTFGGFPVSMENSVDIVCQTFNQAQAATALKAEEERRVEEA
ncbi:hypothetical protein PAXINDRAFT_103881, partial [Paxillus involutus ATCC 200175]